MSFCNLLVLGILFVYLQCANALKCHYCVPDAYAEDVCDINPGPLRECNWDTAEDFIDSLPKSLRKKIIAKGNSFEPRCLNIRLEDYGELIYLRGCMPETDFVCNAVREEAAAIGINEKCGFCGSDGCNGGFFITNGRVIV